jgi:hypothetical protein
MRARIDAIIQSAGSIAIIDREQPCLRVPSALIGQRLGTDAR